MSPRAAATATSAPRALCAHAYHANVRAKGQNNAIQQLHPIVHNQCAKKHKKKSKRHRKRR